MGAPTSSATIEFPICLMDTDIRKELEEEGVRFKEADPRELEHALELDDPLGDMDVELADGILSVQNSEAPYGQFDNLEELFMSKGVPFNRESSMDWDRPPERRVYRPAREGINAEIDDYVDLNAQMEEVVELSEIQNLLPQGIEAIREYLAKHFSDYPPLEAWVKDEGAT
jgi:hypothetical protein